jgi:hypothetical protein
MRAIIDFGGTHMANQGTISIMCRVAATFRNNEGGTYETKPLKIDNAAPAWIQKDRFFDMLVQDGSLVLATTPGIKRALENDPTKGVGPDGKAIKSQAPGGRKKAKDKDTEDEKEPDHQEEEPGEDGADAE